MSSVEKGWGSFCLHSESWPRWSQRRHFPVLTCLPVSCSSVVLLSWLSVSVWLTLKGGVCLRAPLRASPKRRFRCCQPDAISNQKSQFASVPHRGHHSESSHSYSSSAAVSPCCVFTKKWWPTQEHGVCFSRAFDPLSFREDTLDHKAWISYLIIMADFGLLFFPVGGLLFFHSSKTHLSSL